jgi:galacturan 1,4-alpha-galacturonidase
LDKLWTWPSSKISTSVCRLSGSCRILSHWNVDIQGKIIFSNDTTYWQANSFKFVFQNATSFWQFGGEDVAIYVSLLVSSGKHC